MGRLTIDCVTCMRAARSAHMHDHVTERRSECMKKAESQTISPPLCIRSVSFRHSGQVLLYYVTSEFRLRLANSGLKIAYQLFHMLWTTQRTSFRANAPYFENIRSL
jgi:hypothetical protein